MYRVRYQWENPDSQLGAYDILQNAVEKANNYYGFGVFDESGKLVHKSTATTQYYRVRAKWSDEQSQRGAYTVLQNAVEKANEVGAVSVYDFTGKCVYTAQVAVKTMSYTAKLLKNVGSHKKGENVTVTRNRQKQWILTDGTVVKERSGYLDLMTQIYDPNCVYSKEVAEAYVNQGGFKSATNWLFWCNKYGQHVYIFQGSQGNWRLVKTAKCGTGSIKNGDGSDQGVNFGWKIWDKNKVFRGPYGNQYWNMHYSSKGGNSIHKGPTGKPSTHGCISMSNTGVQWVFNNVPINTRVIVF